MALAVCKLQGLCCPDIFIPEVPVQLYSSSMLNKKMPGISIFECEYCHFRAMMLYQNGSFVLNVQEGKIKVQNRMIHKECVLKEFDSIQFICEHPYRLHIYYLVLLQLLQFKSVGLANKQFQNQPPKALIVQDNQLHPSSISKLPDKQVYNKWQFIEKEALKKQLLQFGYGR